MEEYLTYEDNPEEIVESEEDDLFQNYGETEYEEKIDQEEDIEEKCYYDIDPITGQKSKCNPLNSKNIDLDEYFT